MGNQSYDTYRQALLRDKKNNITCIFQGFPILYRLLLLVPLGGLVMMLRFVGHTNSVIDASCHI